MKKRILSGLFLLMAFTLYAMDSSVGVYGTLFVVALATFFIDLG